MYFLLDVAISNLIEYIYIYLILQSLASEPLETCINAMLNAIDLLIYMSFKTSVIMPEQCILFYF